MLTKPAAYPAFEAHMKERRIARGPALTQDEIARRFEGRRSYLSGRAIEVGAETAAREAIWDTQLWLNEVRLADLIAVLQIWADKLSAERSAKVAEYARLRAERARIA